MDSDLSGRVNGALSDGANAEEIYRVNPLDRDASRNQDERFDRQLKDKRKDKSGGESRKDNRLPVGEYPSVTRASIEDIVAITSAGMQAGAAPGNSGQAPSQEEDNGGVGHVNIIA
jgi:hypothetical protein